MEFFPEITNYVGVFSVNSHKPFVVTWNNTEKIVECWPKGNAICTLNLDGNTVWSGVLCLVLCFSLLCSSLSSLGSRNDYIHPLVSGEKHFVYICSIEQ